MHSIGSYNPGRCTNCRFVPFFSFRHPYISFECSISKEGCLASPGWGGSPQRPINTRNHALGFLFCSLINILKVVFGLYSHRDGNNGIGIRSSRNHRRCVILSLSFSFSASVCVLLVLFFSFVSISMLWGVFEASLSSSTQHHANFSSLFSFATYTHNSEYFCFRHSLSTTAHKHPKACFGVLFCSLLPPHPPYISFECSISFWTIFTQRWKQRNRYWKLQKQRNPY